jgi:thiamine-monophosphate kinase
MTIAKKGESAVLENIERHFPHPTSPSARSMRVGIGDDAAILAPKAGYETILTCDWFLENTHFLRDKHRADSVGWKCLARAVSDVAAMGGVPRCFLLSIALPETHTGRWMDEFLGGLRRAARKFQCDLTGGDTTRRPEILINVTVVGEVRRKRTLLRSGARPGDVLFVSGRLGEAEFGLNLLQNGKGLAHTNDRRLRKHLYPEPRLALGRWLAEKRLATAMMDLSDGLSSDLPRLCDASGVGARIEVAGLPLIQVTAEERRQGISPVQLALHGGDDYELLFAVPRNKAKLLPRSFKGVPLTQIGEITRRAEILIVKQGGGKSMLKAGGWDPFRRSNHNG